jgi:hypothetical protein
LQNLYLSQGNLKLVYLAQKPNLILLACPRISTADQPSKLCATEVEEDPQKRQPDRGLLFHRKFFRDREIELKHIHPRLAKDSEIAMRDMPLDERRNALRRNAADLCHPFHL